jgi:hypothetical protein
MKKPEILGVAFFSLLMIFVRKNADNLAGCASKIPIENIVRKSPIENLAKHQTEFKFDKTISPASRALAKLYIKSDKRQLSTRDTISDSIYLSYFIHQLDSLNLNYDYSKSATHYKTHTNMIKRNVNWILSTYNPNFTEIFNFTDSLKLINDGGARFFARMWVTKEYLEKDNPLARDIIVEVSGINPVLIRCSEQALNPKINELAIVGKLTGLKMGLVHITSEHLRYNWSPYHNKLAIKLIKNAYELNRPASLINLAPNHVTF